MYVSLLKTILLFLVISSFCSYSLSLSYVVCYLAQSFLPPSSLSGNRKYPCCDAQNDCKKSFDSPSVSCIETQMLWSCSVAGCWKGYCKLLYYMFMYVKVGELDDADPLPPPRCLLNYGWLFMVDLTVFGKAMQYSS